MIHNERERRREMGNGRHGIKWCRVGKIGRHSK